MPLYRYVKFRKRPPMKRSVVMSIVLMVIGAAMIGWVTWPIVSFNVFAAPVISTVISPVGSAFMPSIQAKSEDDQLDYTNPNIWFPLKPQQKVETVDRFYSLAIPELGLKNTRVEVGGQDLNTSLIHYGGTALPGQIGNGAIFGHSVLPQFFNPLNYKTVFSTLPGLKTGDEIFLTYNQITYRYQVEQMSVRTPEDLTMLEQPLDDAYITLITCVPPGTYWQRLHVRARLMKLTDG